MSERTIQAGKLGHYTWIIDEIQLEEADSKTQPSSYNRPFDVDENSKGLQSSVFTNELTEEFVQLVAYCLGTSFVPPNIEVIRGELNENSKRTIKRLRKRMLRFYEHANNTNTTDENYASLPVIPVQPKFEPTTDSLK